MGCKKKNVTSKGKLVKLLNDRCTTLEISKTLNGNQNNQEISSYIADTF